MSTVTVQNGSVTLIMSGFKSLTSGPAIDSRTIANPTMLLLKKAILRFAPPRYLSLKPLLLSTLLTPSQSQPPPQPLA